MLTGKQQGIVLKTLIISSDFDHPLFSLSINLKFVQVQLKIIFLWFFFFLSYLQFHYVKMFILSEEVEEKLTFFVLYSTSIYLLMCTFTARKQAMILIWFVSYMQV